MFKIEKIDFLICLYIFAILVSEIMGGKTFPLLHIGSYPLNASVAILLLPIVFTINDMITEVYGKERTRSIVRSGLIIVGLLLLFSLLATALPPSQRFLKTEAAYDAIFKTSARIAFASLIAFAIAEFSDVLIFAKLKKRFGKSKLWLRNNVSNFVSQFLDTAIFMTIAFYAFDKTIGNNFSFLFSLILPYWLLKCCMSIIETPFVYLGVKWLKQK
jgi:queuosine precursor transporter